MHYYLRIYIWLILKHKRPRLQASFLRSLFYVLQTHTKCEQKWLAFIKINHPQDRFPLSAPSTFINYYYFQLRILPDIASKDYNNIF